MYELKKVGRLEIARQIALHLDSQYKQKKVVDTAMIVLTILAKKKAHITKRIQSVFKEIFDNDDYAIIYVKKDLWFEISIYNRAIGIDYNSAICIQIGRIGEDQIIDLDRIAELNPWFKHIQPNIDRLEAFNKVRGEYVKRYNAFVDTFNAEKDYFSDVPYPVYQSMHIPKPDYR